MVTRADLIFQARTWIGVPALPSGAQRCGVSCLGLLIGIFRELGGFEELVAEIEKHSGTKRPEIPGALLKQLINNKHLRVLKVSILQPGNWAIFMTRDGPQHLALITEPMIILHASQVKRKVVEHLIPSGWRVAREFEFVGLV